MINMMPHGYTVLCHYLDLPKWGMEDIEKQRIKISLFDAVNDKQELCAYSLDAFTTAGIEELKKWITDTKALLCFSPPGNESYMWQRYGGNHQGMCFVIRVPNEFAMKVKYVET